MQKYQYINIYIFIHWYFCIAFERFGGKLEWLYTLLEISIFFPLQYLWTHVLMYGNGDRWQFYISRKFNFVTLFTDIWSKTNQILGDVMTNLTELLEIFEKKSIYGIRWNWIFDIRMLNIPIHQV